MKQLLDFLKAMMILMVITAPPILHALYGTQWAGNLAYFVLTIWLLVMIFGVVSTTAKISAAKKGELSDTEIKEFVVYGEYLRNRSTILIYISRTVTTVTYAAIAAAGWVWYAGALLMLYWLMVALRNGIVETTDALAEKAKEPATAAE